MPVVWWWWYFSCWKIWEATVLGGDSFVLVRLIMIKQFYCNRILHLWLSLMSSVCPATYRCTSVGTSYTLSYILGALGIRMLQLTLSPLSPGRPAAPRSPGIPCSPGAPWAPGAPGAPASPWETGEREREQQQARKEKQLGERRSIRSICCLILTCVPCGFTANQGGL